MLQAARKIAQETLETLVRLPEAVESDWQDRLADEEE
jgi:hypothetical protein